MRIFKVNNCGSVILLEMWLIVLLTLSGAAVLAFSVRGNERVEELWKGTAAEEAAENGIRAALKKAAAEPEWLEGYAKAATVRTPVLTLKISDELIAEVYVNAVNSEKYFLSIGKYRQAVRQMSVRFYLDEEKNISAVSWNNE